MDDLTAVDGIGDGNVDAIRDLGIETPAELAAADEATVAEASGFGPARAGNVIESATELVEDAATSDETDGDGSGDEADTGEPEPVIDGIGVDVLPDDIDYPVDEAELGTTVELGSVPTFRNRYHAISTLVDKAEQYRRRRRTNKRLAAERALAGFMFDERPTLDEQAWNETNLALIEEEREYRGVSRLAHITSDLRALMNRVNEARERFEDDTDGSES